MTYIHTYGLFPLVCFTYLNGVFKFALYSVSVSVLTNKHQLISYQSKLEKLFHADTLEQSPGAPQWEGITIACLLWWQAALGWVVRLTAKAQGSCRWNMTLCHLACAIMGQLLQPSVQVTRRVLPFPGATISKQASAVHLPRLGWRQKPLMHVGQDGPS